MPTSEKDYEKERKQQEKKRTDILNAHLREIQRNKAQAHQIDSGGSSYGGDMIQSKTDKGLMTSSRHPETGVIHHVWHDEPKIRTEGKASNRSRGNSTALRVSPMITPSITSTGLPSTVSVVTLTSLNNSPRELTSRPAIL